jgi:hypothetical protein
VEFDNIAIDMTVFQIFLLGWILHPFFPQICKSGPDEDLKLFHDFVSCQVVGVMSPILGRLNCCWGWMISLA